MWIRGQPADRTVELESNDGAADRRGLIHPTNTMLAAKRSSKDPDTVFEATATCAFGRSGAAIGQARCSDYAAMGRGPITILLSQARQLKSRHDPCTSMMGGGRWTTDRSKEAKLVERRERTHWTN